MSSLDFNIDVTAFKPVLQELMYLDRTLYKATEKGLKDASKPLTQKIKMAFPTRTLSGLMKPHKATPSLRTDKKRTNDYPVYNIGKIKQGVVARVGGRKRSDSNVFPVLRVVQRNGGAMIYDMAQHDAKGQTLASNLQTKHKTNASRTMYPTVRANIKLVEADIRAEIAKAEKIVSDRLGASGGVSQYQNASKRAKEQARGASGKFGNR